MPHNVLGNRHTNLNTQIRHEPCLQGFIMHWELSLDWDIRPGAEFIIPPREALWWFGQMASGFNMRMRIQGLGQWGQIYCWFSTQPPPCPVDMWGVGKWAASIRESWGGSGILGHGFYSATAGSGGRACWTTGQGLGDFTDYRTLVWEGLEGSLGRGQWVLEWVWEGECRWSEWSRITEWETGDWGIAVPTETR